MGDNKTRTITSIEAKISSFVFMQLTEDLKKKTLGNCFFDREIAARPPVKILERGGRGGFVSQKK